MPSKYSHGVVLARYSSLGLIDLPNKQYLDSGPTPVPWTHSSASVPQSNGTTRPGKHDGGTHVSHQQPTSSASKAPILADARRPIRRRVVIASDSKYMDETGPIAVEDLSAQSFDPKNHIEKQGLLRPSNQAIPLQLDADGLEHERRPRKDPSNGQIKLSSPAPLATPEEFCWTWPTTVAAPAKPETPVLPDSPKEVCWTWPATVSVSKKPRPPERPDNSQEVHCSPPRSHNARNMESSDSEAVYTCTEGTRSFTNSEANFSDVSNSRQHSRQQVCRRSAPAVELYQTQRASPVDSVIDSKSSTSRSQMTTTLSRSDSGYTTETRIYKPLPEDLDFDGFSDMEDSYIIQKVTISQPGSTSKVRHTIKPATELQAETSTRQIGKDRRERLRVASPNSSGQHIARLGQPPSQNNRASRYNSLDSLTNPDSFMMPAEGRVQAFTSRQQKSGSQKRRPSLQSLNSSVSAEDHRSVFTPSLLELKALQSRDQAAACSGLGSRKLGLRQFLDNDEECGMDSHSFSDTSSAVFPPDIAMHRTRDVVGSPLAQVESMLQERENEGAVKGLAAASLSRRDKIREAEEKLKKLLEEEAQDRNVADSVNSAKLQKKQGNTFLRRLRGQK